MGWMLLLLAALAAPAAASKTGAAHLEQIRDVRLDPQQCYRVRDLFLEREDVKFYFTDGHLLFAQPVAGRVIAALFVATEPSDQGELLVIPPSVRERNSVARFTSDPILNERFRTAMMFFTDDSAQALQEGLAKNEFNRLDFEAGEKLAAEWSDVMHNIIDFASLRILFDTVSGQSAEGGFFAAVVGGGKLGRFEVVVDASLREQVSVGQLVWREGQSFYEVWCSFPGRSFREGRRRFVETPGRLENYFIESRFAADLSMNVTARATFIPEVAGQRAYAFELSRQLLATEVLLDGKPVEFLQLEQPPSSEVQRRQNNLVTVVLDRTPVEGERFEIEFHYHGKVVAEAGGGVYYVGSRGTWYPGIRPHFTSFDLLFHYPEDLDLVATGELIETSVEQGNRTTLFRSSGPLRMAGFNLGRYARAKRQVGAYQVEACANLALEDRLKPAVRTTVMPGEAGGLGPRRQFPVVPRVIVSAPLPEAPSASQRIEEVAEQSAQAFQFFLDRFGPPPTRQVVISPIPGHFGQGFPGLVYLSTLSFFGPEDEPLKAYTAEERSFYAHELRVHEIAHQWWGNVVTAEAMPDFWLMEALATYSSLLYLEQARGGDIVDRTLEEYKRHLLFRNEDGNTMESAGAIVLGERLASSRFPNAPRIILYEKGAWIIHMLRRLQGDENFLAFLRELRQQFEYKSLTVEDFQGLAARYVPENSGDAGLADFFDQWVYNTGIPALRVDYRVEGQSAPFKFRGRIFQQNVPDHFTATVPVLIHTLPGRSTLELIRTDGAVTEFAVNLRNRPSRVQLDPDNTLLAVKQP